MAGKPWASIRYLDDEGNAVIDGAATDADAVTAQISAALAAGQSTIYVAGTTLGTALNNAIKAHADGTIDLILADATAIGESAFHGCTALASVSAPKVTTIGENAFDACSALTSLTFGEVITSVGTNAFDGVFADGTAWTTQCTLTLNIGQQSSTVPVSTDEDGNPTWAGYTWASISYVDNDGNAVEGN